MVHRLLAAFHAATSAWQQRPAPTASPPPPPPAPELIPAAPTQVHGQVVPIYPPSPARVPVVSPDALLEAHQPLIDKLRATLGLTPDEFARFVAPVLLRLATFVHLLPASESHHHCDVGGFLRHALECAFYAARLAEGRVFAVDVFPSERKRLDPKWRLAIVYGALLHDIGKPVSDIGAIDPETGREWNGHGQPLYTWLQQHQVTAYHFRWHTAMRGMRHEQFTTVPARDIVGTALFEHLSEAGGQEIANALISALRAPGDVLHNPIAEIVKQADSASVAFDLEDQGRRAAAAGSDLGKSQAAQLARAIHDLVDTGQWVINKPGAPLVWTTQGLFGIPPQIFQRPIELLRQHGRGGTYPSEPLSQVDLVGNGGYLEPDPHAARLTYLWRVAIAQDGIELSLNAVRFTDPSRVLGSLLLPDPLPCRLVDAPSPEPAVSAVSPTAGSAAATPATPAATPPETTVDTATRPASTTNVSASTPPNAPVAPTGAPDQIPARFSEVLPWLREHHGTPGLWLASILDRFARGELAWHTGAFFYEDRIALRFPECFVGLGIDPVPLRNALAAANWIQPDPVSQCLVTEISHAGADISVSFGDTRLRHLFGRLIDAHPRLLAAPAPRAKAAPPAVQVSGMLMGEQVGSNARAVAPEMREALKHQALGHLLQTFSGRKPLLAAAHEAICQALTAFREARQLDQKTLYALLTNTENPLLLEVDKRLSINPRFRPPSLRPSQPA